MQIEKNSLKFKTFHLKGGKIFLKICNSFKDFDHLIVRKLHLKISDLDDLKKEDNQK